MKELLALNKQIQTLAPDKTMVFGQGPAPCNLVLIGEAPGGEEERQCRPFVGSAGKELNHFLEILGLCRDDFYLTNTVKYRPTKENPRTGRLSNRTPNQKELNAFIPYLKEELELVGPNYIVTLGNIPLRAILGDKQAVIGDYHGKLWGNLFPLYHPAAVIYNRGLRETYEADLKTLYEVLHK